MRSQSLPELCLKYAKTSSYKVSNVSVKFEYENENNLRAYITTPHLKLESTLAKHASSYVEMTSNPETVKLYGKGKVWREEYTKDRVQRWENIWNQNNPFSCFSVYTNEGDNFVGSVALDYDNTTPKHFAEISYILKFENWGKGYGSEAVWSVVNPYSEEILKQKFLCNGETYEGVYATARPDNFASLSVLLKAGLEIEQKDFKPKQTQWGDRLTLFKKFAVNSNEALSTDISTNKISEFKI